MNKILIISESMNIGGAEKSLVSMLKMLDYGQYDVSLLLISRSGGLLSELNDIADLKVRGFINPSSNPIASFINKIKYKLIYSWLPANIVGNMLCKGYDTVIAFCEGYSTKWVANSSVACRKVAWVHTDMVNNDWPVKIGVFSSFEEERNAYLRFDEIIGVSDIVSRGIAQRFGCSRVRTIYNIIDNNIKDKAAERVSAAVGKFGFNIVSVGRLEHVKGYDRLIDAIYAIVTQHDIKVGLTLVGDGRQRMYLERKCRDCGLSEVITFAGLQSNPYPYVINSDVFVCPSRQEGFNVAIVEALSLGVPVISTDCAGPAEILSGGEYGLLVDNSTDGLAGGILKLYADENLQKNLRRQSVIRSKDFAPEKQLNLIKQIFER